MALGRVELTADFTGEVVKVIPPPCTTPHFEWTGLWWSECTGCGHRAWSHLRSNPVADIQRLHFWLARGSRGIPDPPAMWRTG